MASGKNYEKIYYYYSVAVHPMFFAIATLLALFFKPVSASALGPLPELLAGILFFSVLPFAMIYSALKRKEITLNLEEQRKRNKFFLPWAAVFFAAYLFYSFYGSRSHAALALSFAAVTVLLFFANRLSKTSWHTAGLSAIITALVYTYGIRLAVLYLILLPTVSLARYKLRAHSLPQLASGALFGAAISFACFALTKAPSAA